MKNLTLLLFLLPITCIGIAINDTFTEASTPIREAKRGEWVFADGKAHCVSDPELYLKYSNHGPIISWNVEPFKDCAIKTVFSPIGCQRVVLTLNGAEGHVFRISLTDNAKKWSMTRIYGWDGPSKNKEAFPQVIYAKDDVPSIKDLNGKAVPFELAVKDGVAKVRIGEYRTTFEAKSLLREKNQFTISFAGGECGIAAVEMVTE